MTEGAEPMEEGLGGAEEEVSPQGREEAVPRNRKEGEGEEAAPQSGEAAQAGKDAKEPG